MTYLGTRPPTVDEWELYEPHHRARMSFRPGLTGMWQVSGRTVVDSITDGVNGRIVQFDPNEIANGILELLNSDVQTKFETSLKGEIVKENLEVGNYIKLFMTYHEDVAAVKGSFKEMLENGVYKADLFSDL